MRLILLIVSTCYFFIPLNACTSFVLHQGDHFYFGKNYDWIAESGMVCTNQRNVRKTAFLQGKENPAQWKSKYGSITFNQYGKEFPSGGMNEAGLVVELMWLDETVYPKTGDQRAVVSELQWIQYQLDNSGTIEEVIFTDQKIRIFTKSTPLHFLIADSTGKAATIEFVDGKMVVHSGSKLRNAVLTNTLYSKAITKYNAFKSEQGNLLANFMDNSYWRFSNTYSMLEDANNLAFNNNPVTYAFDMLLTVAQGRFTKWSIVYDVKGKKIYFKTLSFPAIKQVDFRSFDFNCSTISRVLPIQQSLSGNITTLFAIYSDSLNRKILNESMRLSRERIKFTKKAVEERVFYANKHYCE